MKIKVKIEYDGFLIEEKLAKMLCNQMIHHVKSSTNVKIGNFRGDIVLYTRNNSYLVEFDGAQHYTNATNIKRDILKDKLWYDIYNTNVIRIPYFIQLTTQMFKYYFKELLCDLNIEVIVKQNYKHGFIDSRAILPANFCGLGEKRFIKELKELPKNVFNDIKYSMIQKLNKKEYIEIFPLSIGNVRGFEFLKNNINGLHY